MNTKEIAMNAVKVLEEKKGLGIRLLEVTEVTTLADYFLICTGTSNTHVNTLCDALEETVEACGEPLLHARAIAAGPGSCWTSAAWSATSSPKTPATSTTWSACGTTPSP